MKSNEEFLKYEIEEEMRVEDVDEDDEHEDVTYEITSYGADFDILGLVNRLRDGKIVTPKFQRDYVWNIRDASRFVESILLGLPVPGIFLARDQQSKDLLIIDGQQRLKTLLFFVEGVFNPKDDDSRLRVFKLKGVNSRFEGVKYSELADAQNEFDDYVIHATIVKQDSPENDGSSSMYQIFERLNTGGRALSPQEIRTAVYHGGLIDFIWKLNSCKEWREIFGEKHSRLKDQELLLRYIALYTSSADYKKPMKGFLNSFCEKYRNPAESFLQDMHGLFQGTIRVVLRDIGSGVFRLEHAINAAVFDSVMVGLSKCLYNNNLSVEDCPNVKLAYENLLKDSEYLNAVSQSTSDVQNVNARIEKATSAFAEL